MQPSYADMDVEFSMVIIKWAGKKSYIRGTCVMSKWDPESNEDLHVRFGMDVMVEE